MLVLFALIIRGVSFEFKGAFRNRVASESGIPVFLLRALLLPASWCGVKTNIFSGIPFDANGVFEVIFTLLTPYGILGGLVCPSFAMHESLWLCLRTEDELRQGQQRLFQ